MNIRQFPFIRTVVIIVLTASNVSLSLGRADNSYTIKSAIDLALANNFQIKATREKINEYENAKDLTRSALLPKISLSLSGGSAKSAVNSTQVLFSGNSYNFYKTDLNLNQPLFFFGAISAIKQADYDIQIQKKELEIAERDLINKIIQAFYKIILQQRLLNNLEKNKLVLQKSLETTIYRERIGRAQKLDVLQVKTELASMQPQIEQAKNAYESAAAELLKNLGILGLEKDIVAKGQLKTLYLKDIEGKVDLKQYKLAELDKNAMQIDQMREQRSVVQGKHLPNLALQGDLISNSYTSSDIFSSNSQSWTASVVLTIPIFEGLASKYDSNVYASKEQQLLHQRRDLESNLQLSQLNSRKKIQMQEVSLASAIEADKLAQESLHEATRSYKLATIDFLNFLNAEKSALNAASSLDQIKFDMINDYANYFSTSGQPLQKFVEILEEDR